MATIKTLELDKSIKIHNYARGVSWAMLSYVVSNFNDILMKFLGSHLSSLEVSFFRFFFGVLVLLPLMLRSGHTSFKTSRLNLHLIRALLGFGAISLWCYAAAEVPITLITTVSFTVPLFVLPFSIFFLREKVRRSHWIATFIGFLGIVIATQPQTDGSLFIFCALILSASMFALLDIIAKRMVAYESMLAMLFYFSLGCSIVSFIPALYVWKTPTLFELGLLLLLGIGANLIQYCLLKAFSAIEVSALAPYRYSELLISGFLGWLIFAEVPTISTILGACIIIPSSLYVIYSEVKYYKKA